MKTMLTSFSLFLALLGQALRSLQMPGKAWAPWPALQRVPIPIRNEGWRQDSIRRRRHRGI